MTEFALHTRKSLMQLRGVVELEDWIVEATGFNSWPTSFAAIAGAA